MYIYNYIASSVQSSYIAAEQQYNTLPPVLRAFAELAASFAFNYSLIRFYAVPIVLPTAIAHLAFGALVEVSWRIYRSIWPAIDETEPGQHIARTSSAYFFGQAYLRIAIHELGHALMAYACFKNAGPKISIFPLKGGDHSYAASYGLTSLGQLLGKEASQVAIAGGGIAATTAFALLAVGCADQLKKKYPKVANCLTYQAAAHVLAEVYYGKTAFQSNDLKHDFVYMWRYGNIHPMIPISLLLTLPLAEFAMLSRQMR
jgi:hypothetical protein